MSKSEVSEERAAPVVSLSPKDCRLREAAGNVFRIIAPIGTTVERLEESSFYAVVCQQFRPNDELIILAADRTFYAHYLVLECGIGYCSVHKLSFTKLPAMLSSVGEALPSNHKLVYMGPEEGWSAVRNSDSVVIIRNAVSQQDALQQLCQHASLRQ